MSPVLQALIRVAVRILLGLLLLGEMAFVISCNLPHVGDVLFLVLGWVFLRVLSQDLNNFPPTVQAVSNRRDQSNGKLTVPQGT